MAGWCLYEGEHGTRVKTLVIGEVVCPKDKPSTQRSQAHSYFSRLVDAATFADVASVEISRRGVDRAREVAAMQDGADWRPRFVDGHRHDAVRILDFAHAAGYLGQIAEQAQLLGYHLPKGWLSVLLHQLKHHGPRRVLLHLERLEQRWSHSSISDTLRYFRKRKVQMQYPQFQADGWPIGSGSVGEWGKWQQSGHASSSQGGRHAPAAEQRQSHAGLAHHGLQ
jgi:hypothetical protein